MLARVLAGETQLFHELIRPYERTVYMVALGMLKDEAESEDTAQETFLKAYSALARFRSQSKFSTWLISIAINEARSRTKIYGWIDATVNVSTSTHSNSPEANDL